MKTNTRLSYEELAALVNELRPLLIGSFLKKIYHFNDSWMLKFNNMSLVYEPNTSIWVGEFAEREKDIHSVCQKLRKEIGDRKVMDLFIIKKDRTVVFTFRDFHLILECYNKGNLILTDTENKIVVLTRIYGDIRHNLKFQCNQSEDLQSLFDASDPEFKLAFEQKSPNEFKAVSEPVEDSVSALEASKQLYFKVPKKAEKKAEQKKIKLDPKQQIRKQVEKFSTKVNTYLSEIDAVENVEDFNINFETLNKLHEERKLVQSKMEKAKTVLIEKKVVEKKQEQKPPINLATNRWYHSYHWWFTKNNFLVVGGRNADENEKLVKSYMKDTDFYFHSELPGCGSFILFGDTDKRPEDIDFYDAAVGVLSLSQQWKMGSGGNVYWVHGHQVSKTPPTGEYIVKGSFIIQGKKNEIKIDSLSLGYILTQDNELMLAPYHVITRVSKLVKNSVLKLQPKPDTKKANLKKITTLLKQAYNIREFPSDIHLFNYPCTVSLQKN